MAPMEITPRELRDIEIHSEIRGYSRDEVNDLLERAAAAIDASNERASQLQDRLTSAQSESGRTRETEDILHRTLLLAQRAADEAVAEATAKSKQMIDEAEMSSRRLVADAETEARRLGDTERRRLEQEIVELAGRRDTLLADVEALTRFEAEYRERMVGALETDLSALRTRPTTAPGSKPETSEVEIPASKSAAAANETAAPATPEPVASQADVNNENEGQRDGKGEAGSKDEGEPEAQNPSAESPVARPSSKPEPVGAATSEVDVRTLFEQSRRHDSRATATGDDRTEAVDTLGGGPLRRGTAADRSGEQRGRRRRDPRRRRVLRDAARRGARREAARPRDDDDESGENQFFDQDAERGTFRDVFRRRR